MMAASNVNSNHTSAHLSKSNASFIPAKPSDQASAMDLDQLQHMINCTVKKNPKTELRKSDLLRLLGYLEGELQARDVVIATLKAERVKQQVSHARYGRILPINDPYAALQRDSRSATMGGSSSDDAALLKAVTDGPMAALEVLVAQHRNSHVNLIQAMRDAEARHSQVLRELDDERRKHEHDTAQGDDITYGLEKERTRLREELEVEKQSKKKLEKEMKKLQETLDEERQRQKQIVLLLLAERKKLILKYVEERNKSEDLAQILGEEKGRVDTMAEGLEEESQKALHMEAELEKQLALFDSERVQLKVHLQKEEKRTKELEAIIDKLHTEVDNLKKQQAEAHQVAMFQAGLNQPNSPPRMTTLTANRNSLPSSTSTLISPAGSVTLGPQLPSKPNIPPQTPPRSVSASVVSTSPISIPRTSPSASAPLNSVTGHVVLGAATGKTVQPMALVNSTPVQAPTTGIARAVSPAAGGIRTVQYPPSAGNTLLSNTASRNLPPTPASSVNTTNDPTDQIPAGRLTSTSTMQATSPRVAVSASAGTKVFTTTNSEGKVTFHVTTSATLPSATSTGTTTTSPAQPTTPKKSAAAAARGVPPPVPPNKPVIPPKKSVVTAATINSGSVSGQQLAGPLPVVISCSNHSQVTTVDHGRPISFQVQPSALNRPGQTGLRQAVKFGITISKDQIQISSNADSPEKEMQVGSGGGGGCGLGRIATGHDIPTDNNISCPFSPICLDLPERDVLEMELNNFQQLLDSMTSPTSSSFAPLPGPSGLTSSTTSSAPTEDSSNVMIHMGV